MHVQVYRRFREAILDLIAKTATEVFNGGVIIAIISIVLSVVAILLGGWALLYSKRQAGYAKRQTDLMEEQDARKRREDADTEEWAPKFDEAVRQLMKVATRIFNNSNGPVYPYVFQDPSQRQRIETYLIIQPDPGRLHYIPRQTSTELLRLSIVRQTIQEVLDKIQKFKETDPNAKGLGI